MSFIFIDKQIGEIVCFKFDYEAVLYFGKSGFGRKYWINLVVITNAMALSKGKA